MRKRRVTTAIVRCCTKKIAQKSVYPTTYFTSRCTLCLVVGGGGRGSSGTTSALGGEGENETYCRHHQVLEALLLNFTRFEMKFMLKKEVFRMPHHVVQPCLRPRLLQERLLLLLQLLLLLLLCHHPVVPRRRGCRSRLLCRDGRRALRAVAAVLAASHLVVLLLLVLEKWGGVLYASALQFGN